MLTLWKFPALSFPKPASVTRPAVPPTVKFPAVLGFSTNVPASFVSANVTLFQFVTLSVTIFIVPVPVARFAPAAKSTAFALNVVFLLPVFESVPENLSVAPDSTVSGALTSAVPISTLPVDALPIWISPVPELMKLRSFM